MAETPRALITAQAVRIEQLRARTAMLAAAQWQAADGSFPLERIVQTVLAGQRAIVSTADAALSLAAGVVTRSDTSPLGIEPDRLIGARARNGVSLEHVYSRTAKVAREDGFQRGVAHLRKSIYLDAQLAYRRAAQAHAEADMRVTGWRRQISPGGVVCGFCVAASTRVYRRGDLLPLHAHCRCTVAEIYLDSFSGAVLDRDRLNAVYQETGGYTSRQALGRIEVDAADLPAGVDVEMVQALEPTVRWDAELGPVLDGARHDSSFSI